MRLRAAKSTYPIAVILLTAILILSIVMTGGGAQFASAAASSYSDVLEDLRTDESFNIADYPATSGDYGLYVKQIAESTDGELLIYVYQPAGRQDVRACTICIAREVDNSVGLGLKDYGLEYLNSNGVFFKYRVLDFELKPDAVRYYNISNILRPYDKIIDGGTGVGNTESEVPYPVGQFWTVCTIGDSVTYSMTESEVIEITEKCVGFINYEEGCEYSFIRTESATSTHFVAFSTDKPIDKLISASVSFYEQKVTYQYCGNLAHTNALNGHTYKSKFNYQYGEKTLHDPDPVKVKYTNKVSNIGANNYSWDRIRTSEQFLSDTENQKIELTSGEIASIENTQWVLNFYETEIQVKSSGKEWLGAINGLAMLLNGAADLDCRYTEVSDVMLLQLEFETEGHPFNLGVVDNRQTGSSTPWGGNGLGSGCTTDFSWLNILPWWAWVLIFIAAIVVLILIVLLIVWIVSMPFRTLTARAQAAVTYTPRRRRRPKKTKGK